MSSRPIDSLADALVEAHRLGAASVDAAGLAPASVFDAYRVQQRVLDRLAFGSRPVAWKVSPAKPGEEWLASPVPGKPLASPAMIEAGTRRILGVEAEVAFRFAASPPVPATMGDVRAAVDSLVVLVELCETRLAGIERAPALAKLADFQCHGAFVVGSGQRNPAFDAASQRVRLEIGGRLVADTAGSHPDGRLWEMVLWAVGHCAGRGLPLQAGDLVTTGSWTGLAPIAPGEGAVARFEGLGEARLALG